jgi:3-oxoacyl-[acyl-carrier-protein] synthase II
MGAVSPLGLTVQQLWEGLRAGRCGIKPITAFDPVGLGCRIAGQVPQFSIQQYVPRSYRKATKLMSRDIQLAVAASDEALRDSGLVTKGIDAGNVNIEPQRVALNIGAGLISCELAELGPAAEKSITDGQFDIRKWGKDGLEAITPLWLLKYLPNMLACHISIIHDIQGPSNTITCAEVSGQLAIGEAGRVIQRGAADAAVAGAAEAKIDPILLLRQILLKRATCECNEAPEGACRPFDAEATGSVFGEGGGILVLEELERARRRKAKIYAEVVGFGCSSSLNPVYEQLEQDGRGVQIAIEKGLAEAGIRPSELDLIVPHGTGISADDAAEARGIAKSLGAAASEVPVWPTKSILSNTGAASGALDVIAAVCAMRAGIIPTAYNLRVKAVGCALNINTQERKKAIRYALCCSYTYGGQTAALVLKNVNGQGDA